MRAALALAVPALALVIVAACGPPARATATATTATAATGGESASATAAPAGGVPSPASVGPPSSAPAAASVSSQQNPSAAGSEVVLTQAVAASVASLDLGRMNDHLLALAAVESRDPRHPGHAKAVAYIREQLEALTYRGWRIESLRTVYQGIPLESIFATIDPAPGARAPNGVAQQPPPPVGERGWVMLAAHYDSTATRTAGWRPSVDPAPGADDNATGTAALLEIQRALSDLRAEGRLGQRVVLAFFDGEELFFKGSAAYLATLPRPAPYAAVLNIDMVGFNPLADRLDLIWYTDGSAALRDRVVATNAKYQIGIAPLNLQFAADGNTILDAAPFGLAGIPSIALVERYGSADATYPGNPAFHTPNDTPAGVTNRRLWLKAARLTLATALEMVVRDPRPSVR